MRLTDQMRAYLREIGKRGGKARNPEAIPASDRSEIAKRAAKARWAKATPEERQSSAARMVEGRRKSRGRRPTAPLCSFPLTCSAG